MIRTLALAVSLLVFPSLSYSQTAQPGERYQLVRSYETKESGSDGSSSSSGGHDTIEERIVAVGPDGIEFEYDLAADATAKHRASQWQLPARIFRPSTGPWQLRNRAALEARVDAWLKSGNMTRAACGEWIFTWNAFRIECDPDGVIEMVESFLPEGPDLREGALYRIKGSIAAAPLRRGAAGKWKATAGIDAEAVRNQRAESDVVVKKISGTSITIAEARLARSSEQISGTVEVTFAEDASGLVLRRTIVANLNTRKADGTTVNETRSETVERERLR